MSLTKNSCSHIPGISFRWDSVAVCLLSCPERLAHFFSWVLPGIFNPVTWGIICMIGFLVGIKSCQFTGIALNSPDDGSMVWDEIIAFWLVLVIVTPASFLTEFLAFIVFRFFDMVKPPPIRYFDQRIKGGFGVMLDDIIAAFFTLLVFALWKTCFMTT